MANIFDEYIRFARPKQRILDQQFMELFTTRMVPCFASPAIARKLALPLSPYNMLSDKDAGNDRSLDESSPRLDHAPTPRTSESAVYFKPDWPGLGRLWAE